MKTDLPQPREKSLIKNAVLEEMFLRIANDPEVCMYIDFIRKGRTDLATAYATRKVKPIFMFFVDDYRQKGGDIELIKEQVYRKRR